MVSFESLDFEPSAEHVFEQFLLLRPNVAVEGLFRVGRNYFIAVPAVGISNAPGQELLRWFNQSLKPVGYPISLVAEPPQDAEPVRARTAAEIAAGFGVVRTRPAMARDLALTVPGGVPYVGVREEDREAIVSVERTLSPAEHEAVERTFESLGMPLPMRVEVAQPRVPTPTARAAKAAGSHDLALVPARMLSADIPRSVREMVAADDEFWRREIRDGSFLEAGAQSANHRHWLTTEPSCLIETTFPPGNLRTYASVYPTLLVVAPLATNLDRTLAAFGVNNAELLELSRRGVIRWLLPQAIDRYDGRWLGELFEAAPDSVMLSRRLAAVSAQDQHRRNPLLIVHGSAYERRGVLRGLHRFADSSPRETRIIVRALASALSEHWALSEYMMQTRGAMASVSGGLARFAGELGKSVFGKDLFVELGASALNVEWAGAFGAHLLPTDVEGYSSEGADGFLVALASGSDRAGIRRAVSRQIQLVDEVLAIDNDTNIVELVTELGTGDLARFRNVVAGLARGAETSEQMAERVRDWNAQVRAYERRPDRVKSFGIAGIVIAGASQLSANETIRTTVPILAPLMPALMTLLSEELVRESPVVGKLMDWANGALAGTSPQAVLLSRMRKRVAGMKESNK